MVGDVRISHSLHSSSPVSVPLFMYLPDLPTGSGRRIDSVMSGKIRVFIACSLDGFIAGENDDLSWLPGSDVAEAEDYGYDRFMYRIGAVLMGRRTYDVVARFNPWPYGDLPVLVATHRDLPQAASSVRAVSGSIPDVVARAREIAGDKDVYLDGGHLVRQALDAALIDEMTVSFVPVVLGRGRSLFAGSATRHGLTLTDVRRFEIGLVQLTFRPT